MKRPTLRSAVTLVVLAAACAGDNGRPAGTEAGARRAPSTTETSATRPGCRLPVVQESAAERYEMPDGPTADAPMTAPPAVPTKMPGVLTVGMILGDSQLAFTYAGQPHGFEVDLVAELARHLGRNLDIRPVVRGGVGALVAGLLTAEYDVALAGLAQDTSDNRITFSDPYLDERLAHTADLRRSPARDLGKLPGGTPVSVAQGSTAASFVAAHCPGLEPRPMPTNLDALAALADGRVHAAVNAFPQFFWAYPSGSRDRIQIVQAVRTGRQYAVAARRDRADLAAAVNEALRAIRANGRYGAIYQEWIRPNLPEHGAGRDVLLPVASTSTTLVPRPEG